MHLYFSDDELATCLIRAYRDRPASSNTVSKRFYDKWRRGQRTESDTALPTSQTFTLRFGSWSGALGHFGLPINPTSEQREREGFGIAQYEDEALIEFLRMCESEYGKVSASIYDAASKAHGWPSLATVRNRFGSWRNALEVAGLWQDTKALVN